MKDGEFEANHTQVNNKDRDITTRYSCHTWMSDGPLILCTEVGEIIVLDDDGSYMSFVPDSPMNDFKIEAIVSFSRGFIVAGNGLIYAYEKSEDPRALYRQITEPINVQMDSKDNNFGSHINFLITSLTLSHSEDYIYFITKSKQLLKVDIPLYDGSEQKSKVDFVHCCYHTSDITGLDVCIRKQLIVTCSRDRTVKIWNYVTKTLEISQTVPEDALAVAFHPSGFHVVVAIQDKITLYNVLSKCIQPFKNIQVKGCTEIKFSNGGHLFAAAYGSNATYVFNFYTNENPPNFQCKGHIQKVRAIDWFDDDMGFVSAGQGGDVFFWELLNVKEGSNRLTDKDFT